MSGFSYCLHHLKLALRANAWFVLAAMSFLIPLGVTFYAAIGGLKATFTTSYMHTVIVYGVCLFFLFKVRAAYFCHVCHVCQ